jgi:hypothetical protein
MMDFVYPLAIMALLGGIVIVLCVRPLPEAEGRWLTLTLAVALVFRLVAASTFELLPETRIFHEDAEGYEYWGMLLSHVWHSGAPTPPMMTMWQQNSGWRYVAGGVYYLFGEYRPLLSFFNCILGTLEVFTVYRLARMLFHPLVAKRAALLTALMPSLILWSATALKDTMMGLLILVALLSCVALKRRFSFWAMVGITGSLAAMQPIRYYIVYFLGFAIVTSLLLERGAHMIGGVYKQVALAAAVIGLLAIVGATTHVSAGAETLSLERVSGFRHGMAVTAHSGFSADVDVSTPAGAIAFLPIGLAELLLGPFPWQWSSRRALMAVPETLYWWFLFPALLRGMWSSFRERFAATSPLIIFAVIMSCAYALMQGNVGAGFRQRAQIFVILFIFAAYGKYRKRAMRENIEPKLLLAGEPA